MNRRDAVVALGALTTLPTAWAAGEPVEGKEYQRLQTPVPVAMPGKVEVIEFFGYWCPHCNAFEPPLYAWASKLPPDVNMRRIPVAFAAWQESLQKLYFAIEAMGAIPALHGKVFLAIHAQHQRLDKDAEVMALAQANGVDGAKLVQLMKSFTISTKVSQARQLAQTYGVDSVPKLFVQGTYTTDVAMGGGDMGTLRVLDGLIQKSRAKLGKS